MKTLMESFRIIQVDSQDLTTRNYIHDFPLHQNTEVVIIVKVKEEVREERGRKAK